MTYQVQLLVLEEGKLVRKPLAEIDFPSLEYAIILDTYENDWNYLDVKFDPTQLVEGYFGVTHTIDDLFCQFPEARRPHLYEKIMSVDISFAGKEAYCKVRSDPDSTSLAFFSSSIGIVQRLGNYPLAFVCETLSHEFGHALSELMDPIADKKRDPTMHEVMAIFVEEKLGFNAFYKDPPHRQAKEILRCLAHTRFSLLDFPEQWEFLNSITDEKDIPARISSSFPPERPLIKLLNT